MTWRTCTDWAKKRQATLRLADFLGRGRGRLRVFDRVNAPPPARHRPDLTLWLQHDLAAIWIGHATVLLRIDGMTVLTDPVFFNRVGVGLGLITGGPRRVVAPALHWRELPKIDLMVISHAHFDHLDRPSLARLNKRTPIITARYTADLIADLGYDNITELDWGQTARFGSLQVTAREVCHWGARTFYDSHRGFNGYLLQGPRHRVLYAGDTAFQDYFSDVGGVDLGIFGIGAYDPYIAAHATPEQAWQMAEQCRAKWVLPMHHGTFRLSHEPMHEPLQRLLAAAGKQAHRVILREVGHQWTELC